jgi:hypothetical protein
MRVLHIVSQRALQLMLVVDLSNLFNNSPGKFPGGDPGLKKNKNGLQ